MSAIAEMAATEAERSVDPQTKAACDRIVAVLYVTEQCQRCGRGAGLLRASPRARACVRRRNEDGCFRTGRWHTATALSDQPMGQTDA